MSSHRFPRPWKTALLVGIAVVAIFFIALLSVIPLSSDTARAKIVEQLAARLDSEVQLDSLSLKVLPRLRVEGAGLTIRHKGRHDVPPLISVRSFAVEGNVADVLHRHVSMATLEGLKIQIPPDDHEDSGSNKPPKLKPAFVIDDLFTKDAQLVILPSKPTKQPKIWSIHQLHMRPVAFDKPMAFEATLTNGVPPGEIETKGTFGPWHPNQPGNTPLSGSFTFENADLSVFDGISGILSSTGTFGGTLQRISTHGDSMTPDFALTSIGHTIPLHAKYDAIVDGTNGETFLERIDGSWLNTSLVAKGSVADAPDLPGRQVDIDVAMDRARIEDVLWLTVKAPKPPMTGALALTTHMVLPPGKVDVVKKLLLDGKFTLSGARFTSLDVQKKIEELSHRSRGEASDQKAEQVKSDFVGSFKLGRGVLAIPSVSFGVPGSIVRLSGTYGLTSEAIDFKGTLFMQAKISQAVGGFKGLLLKIVDPLFKGKNGGSAIPIKISGRRDNPDFGLDKSRVFKH
jgi:hypothetical protein